MKITVFSDVHGNLAGLNAILNHLDERSDIDEVIFAGDACLFGPRPSECIAELAQRDIRCLVGNTDSWILEPPVLQEELEDDIRLRRKRIAELCAWSLEQLDAQAISWLEALQSSFEWRVSPSVVPDDDLLVVHANPHDLLQIIFPREEVQLRLYGRIRQDQSELTPLLERTRASVLAYGHLHIPGRREWRKLSLVNVSSVSIPGDGDPRAKYATFSWDPRQGWEIEHHYVEYSWEDEFLAFEESKPPYWEQSVQAIRESGYLAQVV